MRRWMIGALSPVVVLVLLWPPLAFEATLAMPLRGIRGGVPFPLPVAMLVAGVVIAAVQAVGLHRALDARGFLVGTALGVVPLLLSLPVVFEPAVSSTSVDGLRGEIERVGMAGTTQLWALLTVAAILASLALALAARRFAAWRDDAARAGWRPARAGLAAMLAVAFVALILLTSTGVDFLSSWTRWGAIGVAMAASASAALIPSDTGDDTEPAIHALLFACIGVSLLAQREYVAALAADTLASVSLVDPAAYEHSLREIARAVEPRER